MTAAYAGHSVAGLTQSAQVFYRGGAPIFTKEGTTTLANDGAPVAGDYVRSPMQAARSAGGTGLSHMHPGTWVASLAIAQWRNTSGTAVMRVVATGTASAKLQYWDGSAWVDVGSAITALAAVSTTSMRFLVNFSGVGTSSGSLKLFMEQSGGLCGTAEVAGANLTNMVDIGQIEGLILSGGVSSSKRIGGLFIKDGAGEAAYVYAEIPTSNGTDATDGTGGEPEIDDTLAGYDNDFVSLPASGNRRSFKCAARDFGGRSVKCVSVELRLRCGASGPTQAKCYLLIGGTRYYHPTTVTLTTNFSPYTFSWDTNPATSAAWSASAAADGNLEFGYEVV